jgi:hypothetical protein
MCAALVLGAACSSATSTLSEIRSHCLSGPAAPLAVVVAAEDLSSGAADAGTSL